MGKKINIEASDEPCMFQFFKKYIPVSYTHLTLPTKLEV